MRFVTVNRTRMVLSLCAVAALAPLPDVHAQPPTTYRFAAVALADDPAVRRDFEDGLVAKLRARSFDVVTSHDIVPKASDIDNKSFVRRILEADDRIVGILMLRPAAIGPGSSLEAVRDQIRDDVFRDMQSFAAAVSPTGSDDLIAVIHMAVYMLRDDEPIPLTAGAVWLDDEVDSRQQGIARLQDLIVDNLDAARPSIREFLGLPPLD
jgi:hypothetical protein